MQSKKSQTNGENKRRFSIFILISCIYFAVSLVFYFNLWKQVFTPETVSKLTMQGESPIYEYVAERVKNNILSFKNPFTPVRQLLYPFGWNFALDDVAPINGFYFIFLRPFLSIHQSFMLITLLSVYLSSLSMFYLLRLLGIKNKASLIGSLIFGFSPFIAVRIGAHPSYIAFYIFSFQALVFILLLKQKERKSKLLLSFLLGVFLTVTVLTNLYFTVMTILMCGILFVSFYIFNKEKIQIIFKDIYYILISLSMSMLLLLPWLKSIARLLRFSKYVETESWVDSIAFSSDLTNFIIPHQNLFYKPLLSSLKNYDYIRTRFEAFTYPGLIIIICFILFLFLRNKMSKNLKPLFFSILFFVILTLGPFLQIFGHKLPIPLPYSIIISLPYLQMARAPGRFIVPVIFLASIISAFVLNYLFQKKNRKQRWLIFSFILLIFAVDNSASLDQPRIVSVPTKIYKYLSYKQNHGPLLEVPFSLRDSLKYLGDYDKAWLARLQPMHQMSIFSIYAGRIRPYEYEYFKINPLFNLLDQIITEKKVLNDDSITNKSDLKKLTNAIDFFGIEYLLLKKDESYAPHLEGLIIRLGFRNIMNDNNYTLFYRKKNIFNLTRVNFDNDLDILVLIEGWSYQEANVKTRWTVGNYTKVLFRADEKIPTKLHIKGEAIVSQQSVNVYANDIYAGRLIFKNGEVGDFTIDIKNKAKLGLNLIKLTFSQTHQLSKIIPNSQDKRHLSLNIKQLYLE